MEKHSLQLINFQRTEERRLSCIERGRQRRSLKVPETIFSDGRNVSNRMLIQLLSPRHQTLKHRIRHP